MVGDGENKINALKMKQNNEFKIKDLRNLKYFFGIEAVRLRREIHMCRSKYVLDLLNDIAISGGRISTLPLDQNTKLSKDEREPIIDPMLYKRLIGRLMYLTLIRPNLAYSIQTLSQFI